MEHPVDVVVYELSSDSSAPSSPKPPANAGSLTLFDPLQNTHLNINTNGGKTPRRWAPSQYSPRQLSAIRALVAKEEIEATKAREKVATEQTELDRLTRQISKLEQTLKANKVVKMGAHRMGCMAEQLNVLRENSYLLREGFGYEHDYENDGNERVVDFTDLAELSDPFEEDHRAFKALAEETKALQNKLAERSQKTASILNEKLEYLRLLQSTQAAKVAQAQQIVNLHLSTIHFHKCGALNIVSRLPCDILIEIFRELEYYRMCLWTQPGRRRDRLILSVSQVCWYWKEVCLSFGNSLYCRDSGPLFPLVLEGTISHLIQRSREDHITRNTRLHLETQAEMDNSCWPPRRRHYFMADYCNAVDQIKYAAILVEQDLLEDLPAAETLHLTCSVGAMMTIPANLLRRTKNLGCFHFHPDIRLDITTVETLTVQAPSGSVMLDSLGLFNLLQRLPNLREVKYLVAPGSWFGPTANNNINGAQNPPICARHLRSLAVSSELIVPLQDLISSKRLVLPRLTRMAIVAGQRSGLSAILKQIRHLQFRSNGGVLDANWIFQYLLFCEALDTLEVSSVHVENAIAALLYKDAPNLSFKNLIICNWKGDGRIVWEYVTTRQATAESFGLVEMDYQEDRRLKMVRFENCPNVEGPIREMIGQFCECQWSASCDEVNGWTTR